MLKLLKLFDPPPPQELGVLKEVEAVCVLDFYVHEAVQRQGVGRKLFEVGVV